MHNQVYILLSWLTLVVVFVVTTGQNKNAWDFLWCNVILEGSVLMMWGQYSRLKFNSGWKFLKATPTSQHSSKENTHWTLQWHPEWIIWLFFSINCRLFRYSEMTNSSFRQDLIAFGPKSIPRKDWYALWETVGYDI